MSDTSVIAILASVGIFFGGSVAADAKALAEAVQVAKPSALIEFVRQHPDSKLAPDALLLASEVTKDRADDSATSPDNPKLTCTLSIKRAGLKAIVTWATTDAESIGLGPLGFGKNEPIPQKGERTVDLDDYMRVALVVRDAEGHEIKCSVVLSTSQIDNKGAPTQAGTYTVSA